MNITTAWAGVALMIVGMAVAVNWIESDPGDEQAMIKRCMSLPSDSTDEVCADWFRGHMVAAQKQARFAECKETGGDWIPGLGGIPSHCSPFTEGNIKELIERSKHINDLDMFIGEVEKIDTTGKYESELGELRVVRSECATGSIEKCRAAFVGGDQ